MDQTPSDVDALLTEWRGGDSSALERLVPHVYEELRRLAKGYLRKERPDHTLQPTALVHEMYLRMAGRSVPPAEHRVQFLGIAARLMRQILVDHARGRNRLKRGNGAETILLGEAQHGSVQPVELTALDEALGRL